MILKVNKESLNEECVTKTKGRIHAVLKDLNVNKKK